MRLTKKSSLIQKRCKRNHSRQGSHNHVFLMLAKLNLTLVDLDSSSINRSNLSLVTPHTTQKRASLIIIFWGSQKPVSGAKLLTFGDGRLLLCLIQTEQLEALFIAHHFLCLFVLLHTILWGEKHTLLSVRYFFTIF